MTTAIPNSDRPFGSRRPAQLVAAAAGAATAQVDETYDLTAILIRPPTHGFGSISAHGC
ncbi:MAG TPA: hypothetical protein VH373_02625 [Jatrophihabitantaceae bacterium]|jgi:hypothetical protein